MIINSAPQNEAIIANVGHLGEFRIRQSAKAFSILSSGLYANKIRAIIRELSCNAVDSHVAAGNEDVPFDVHMPTAMEPWFAIRDYGTGLTHDQVTNIYTTYFESTKTGSNQFIGALGLGSKSPFSYTDNFTVTAIRDGRCGIYSAFINEHGVPTIALMAEFDSADPAGVEVKLAVNEPNDFLKFRAEAAVVYRYINRVPNITGASVNISPARYEMKDIIPGVHSTTDHHGGSVAVMGNIAYPINVPNSQQVFGNLATLLDCNLEMHFDIGDLDIQASREGLSYIPQTIESIKDRLTLLNNALHGALAEKADQIENLWERAEFLRQKHDLRLWKAACHKYVSDTKLPTVDIRTYDWSKTLEIPVEDLAKNYNIQVHCVYRSGATLCSIKPTKRRAGPNATVGCSTPTFKEVWGFRISTHQHFVINDLKVGATSRIRYHYKTRDLDVRTIYSIEPADRTQPMLVKEFFESMYNPPEANIVNASTLAIKPREASATKNVSCLRLETRGGTRGGWGARNELVWRDAGKISNFNNPSLTYYYVPLAGFTVVSNYKYTSAKDLRDDVNNIPGMVVGDIYGIRKGDLEWVKKLPNWKNLEDHVAEHLQSCDVASMMMSVVKNELHQDVLRYNFESLITDRNSPMKKFLADFQGVSKTERTLYSANRLFQVFMSDRTELSPVVLMAKYRCVVEQLEHRYPLLPALQLSRVSPSAFADYINMVDQSKKEGV